MSDRIQSGVYFRAGQAPPPSYRLLLLNITPDAATSQVASALASLWSMLHALRAGDVRELEEQPRLHKDATRSQFEDLRVVVGYGRRLFDSQAHRGLQVQVERPPYLSYLDSRSAFPCLAWASQRTPGETDIAMQFTASSAAAVNCAAVEVWKAIQDHDLPLEPVVTYDGFARPDRRGWLEFHDGVSNMDSAHRHAAIAATEPAWMQGGTYMTFLRTSVDLALWRSLGRRRQEIAVGRDKLTGAALEKIREAEDGELIPEPRAFDPEDADAAAEWRDPSQRADRHLEATHVHRANQSRASPGALGAFRVFRQGYEFLEELSPAGPRLGLNFVSFQRDLRVFQHLMNAPGWLGDANFGGDSPGTLLTLVAGGLYALPPEEGSFPGENLFAQGLTHPPTCS